jgi:hypothetical protein
MFHPDLVAEMIRLEQAERLREAERLLRVRRVRDEAGPVVSLRRRAVIREEGEADAA